MIHNLRLAESKVNDGTYLIIYSTHFNKQQQSEFIFTFSQKDRFGTNHQSSISKSQSKLIFICRNQVSINHSRILS